MSINALTVTPKPKHRLRATLFATALLIGGGLIGAVVAGPTFGQGSGQSGPDGPRWHRGWSDSDSQEEGPRWRRGQTDEEPSDEGPGRLRRFGQGGMGHDSEGPRWRRGQTDEEPSDQGPGWRHRFGQGGMGHDSEGPRWRRSGNGYDGSDEGPGGRRRFGQGGMERDGEGPRWRRGQNGEESDEGPGGRRGFGDRFGAMAHESERRRFGGGDFGGRMLYPGAIERRVNGVLGAIDASTEQRKKVRAIFEQAANDLHGLRQQRADNRRQIAQALTAATIDRARIEALRTDQVKLSDASSKRLTDALIEAAEVLTPAQRADLARRFERRRGG